MFLLMICLLVVPFLLGAGTLRILYGKKQKESTAAIDFESARAGILQKKNDMEMSLADCYITGILVLIGMGEAVHLVSLFAKLSFRVTAGLFAGLAGGCTLIAVFLLLWKRRKKRAQKSTGEVTIAQQGIYLVVGFLILLQMVYIVTNPGFYRSGDMTLETIRTFQASDFIYQINPLTGQAYSAGVPLRIQILSLPALYASLSSIFGVDPLMVICQAVPAMVLLGSYLVYGRLGNVLFGRNTVKRGVFLLLVVILFWAGDYLEVMDGFGIMHAGYRGTAIRSVILIPYTITMCLRGRWKSVVLCILAEACIVWTFYGMGACLMVTCLMLCARFILGGRAGGRSDRKVDGRVDRRVDRKSDRGVDRKSSRGVDRKSGSGGDRKSNREVDRKSDRGVDRKSDSKVGGKRVTKSDRQNCIIRSVSRRDDKCRNS